MIDFKNKNIAVLGLGIEGKDVCRYLIKSGVKNITVFDQKTAAELGNQIPQLRVKDYRLGKGYLKDGLTEYDLIFRSPAFKLSLPEVMAAKKAGAVISSATKLFFDLCPGKIIGVTGTKGKGTTATLIYRILKKAEKKVFLAGNIGDPMLAILPKITAESYVVLELSSFQLQDLTKSPHLSVVLFIASEHMDYHQTLTEYLAAKSNIIRFQQKQDFSILNADNRYSASLAKITNSQVKYYSQKKRVAGCFVLKDRLYLQGEYIGRTDQIKLIGRHNLDNICAATLATSLLGVKLTDIKAVIFSFAGLEHRLEKIGSIGGVDYYNDSFSTVPETTIAAIRSFERPIVLIAGGSEKGSDYRLLGKEISRRSIKSLILIGEMADRMRKAVITAGFTGKIFFRPQSMVEIVKIAAENAKSGDIVLLSPGCASFGMFKDYKDRGNQFKKYVTALKSLS